MIIVNMDKAKSIGHAIRRAQRAAEFAPFDKVIAAQIPGNSMTDAEAQRQAIRDKYAVVQTAIDQAETAEEIKQALGANDGI
jgi:hypothetical protein